jgi:hypothetical protein
MILYYIFSTVILVTPGGRNTVHNYTKKYTEQHIVTDYPVQNVNNSNNTQI